MESGILLPRDGKLSNGLGVLGSASFSTPRFVAMARFQLNMADIHILSLSLVVLICSTCSLEYNENALNAPQLLLPYTPSDVFPANYTLRALKGCLRW